MVVGLKKRKCLFEGCDIIGEIMSSQIILMQLDRIEKKLDNLLRGRIITDDDPLEPEVPRSVTCSGCWKYLTTHCGHQKCLNEGRSYFDNGPKRD